MNNDGFVGFVFGSAGADPAATIRALEAIGAWKTAAIVRRACAKFPGGTPPADQLARQELLLDMVSPDDSQAFEQEDADFLAYEEDLAGLVAAYSSRSN